MAKTAITSSNATADLLLLLLFTAVVTTIVFRINIEATGYITPDSIAYLGLAQNLKEGHGFYVLNAQEGSRYYFAIWPVGYPVLIYLMAAVSGLSVFWASKAVNLLFLLFGFLLIRSVNRRYSYVIASIYGSFTLLEIYSYTWSEAPFVFGLFYLAYLVTRHLQGSVSASNIILLFLTCLFLFLIRYVGAFAVSVPVILAGYTFYKKKYPAAIKLTVASATLLLLIGLYLGLNLHLNGHITGLNRLYRETETAGQYMLMLFQGLLNEFLIIRNYHFDQPPDILFISVTVLQGIIISVITYMLATNHRALHDIKRKQLSQICFCLAFLYFFAIISLRVIAYFDPLDYRLLAPFSFLILIGITNYIAALPSGNNSFNKVRWITVGFFLLSLLLNLPKQYLLRKVTDIF